MKKIAFIITGLATGGAEIVLHNLLQRLDRAKFDPLVISLTGKGQIGPRIEALGIPVIALGMRPGLPNPLGLLRLARCLREWRPDVVHTWMYHADLMGGLAARLAGCHKVIWGIHHSNLSISKNKRSTLMVVRACACLSPWVPERILACSAHARMVHEAAGYRKSRMHVIPNGFDLNRFRPDPSARDDVRAELGLAPDVLLVGLIARYDVQKNHVGFIEAAVRIHGALPQVHFVLAGTGVDYTNISLRGAIAAHPGLAEKMHLLGRRDDIPRLMAALDVLASSSDGEAFGNVLCEAMACGVPCVTTDSGGTAEVVSETGRVVAAGDMAGLARGIVALLGLPPQERAALGARARERVRAHYEIGHVVALYQAAYVSVADLRV